VRLGLAKALDRALGSLLGGAVSAADLVAEALRPPPPVERVGHVLVVKFWGMGNWALLRPVVRDLRDRWPGARVTVATLAANEPLVRDLADRLLLVRSDGLLAIARDLVAAAAALRRDPPDLAVDFEQFARSSALLARLGGAAQRVGFRSGAPGRDGLYTVLVPFRADAHASRSFRDLAEAAGVAPGAYRAGDLAPTERGRAEALRLLPDAGAGVVALHPGSGDNFPGRRWSEGGFAAVGRAAAARGHRVVVTGGAAETALAARVAAAVGPAALSAAGRLSVEGLVGLLARCRALVSNDTGPVHVASALGVPVLAIFGPNTPVLYGPLSAGSRAFFRGLPCSPCLTTANYRSSRCRIFTCMASIPTGEVAAALAALLDSRGAPLPPRTPWSPAPSS
jgi:ADP-heptose:LPS heptosyltransferase